MVCDVVWFRKCLRLHDNPSLIEALKQCKFVLPLFVIDPKFLPNSTNENNLAATGEGCGSIQFGFFLECLQDLDAQLRKLGSRLVVIRGDPRKLIPQICKSAQASHLYFEEGIEPYAIDRDEFVSGTCESLGINVHSFPGETLYPCSRIQNPARTYRAFVRQIEFLGAPAIPSKKPVSMPHISDTLLEKLGDHFGSLEIPTLLQCGFLESKERTCPFVGGETEAGKRLQRLCQNKHFITSFQKPKTNPNSFEPDTTALSPYITHGCLSPRLYWWKIQIVYNKSQGHHSKPPTSLHGQIYFREWFYHITNRIGPKFFAMKGNPTCMQIEWEKNDRFVDAWARGQTGFPVIDAYMRQLNQEGWIHHLARHMVACFFTRGQMWQSWEKGRDVFANLLIDGDAVLNNANWMWLSASCFFEQYWRCYSPVAFMMKYDPKGDFVRKYVPELKNMPSEFIYQPWKAPKITQRIAQCKIGVDYPKPILNHEQCRKENMQKMKRAYLQGPPSEWFGPNWEKKDGPKNRDSFVGERLKHKRRKKKQPNLHQYFKKR